MPEIRSKDGYTLVEVVMVIIIIGILAAIAFRSMGRTIDVSRTEETMDEMEHLAWAIAGDPNLVSGGIRTDFGYVGDVGALPPDWDALITNPGGYATWDGPYIQDEFVGDGGDFAFKLDGWGKPYSLPNAVSFSSSGGPEPITRRIANSLSDLLSNNVTVSGGTPPNSANRDSVKVLLTYPDGTGSLTTAVGYPGHDGLVRFNSIPIGIHTMRMIYIPDHDTLQRQIAVIPGHDFYADLQYFGDVW